MKQLSAMCMLCLLWAVSAFALTRADHIESGEYAYYLDTRGDANFIRGYCALRHTDGLTVLSRNIDLNTNNEMNYYFTLSEPAEGSCKLTDMAGLYEESPSEIKQAYIDFVSYISIYEPLNSQLVNAGIAKMTKDNDTHLFYFNKVLPFFRFSEIREKKDSAPFYVLLKGGKIYDPDAAAFLNASIFPPEEQTRKNIKLKIPKQKKGDYTINGLTAQLDKNWEYNEDFGQPGYWLNIHGRLRDAQIMIEKADVSILEGTDNLIQFARLSLAESPYPDYRSLESTQTDKHIGLSYFLYDENGYKNYQYCFICIKESNLYIINFSAFADIFEANEAYFHTIISHILEVNNLRS